MSSSDILVNHVIFGHSESNTVPLFHHFHFIFCIKQIIFGHIYLLQYECVRNTCQFFLLFTAEGKISGSTQSTITLEMFDV